jgi:hypothetical protein
MSEVSPYLCLEDVLRICDFGLARVDPTDQVYVS